MAETEIPARGAAGDSDSSRLIGPETAPRKAGLPRASLHEIYALPLPIRTYPLPYFHPANPFSWLHVAFTWVRQALYPPPAEPAVVHEGIWNPATRSVHVADADSMRDLWRQGFFGKGSLSRSEPSWLAREKARRGMAIDTSEMRTAQRRQDRADAKWERGRAEQEAIERKRAEEEAARTRVQAVVAADTSEAGAGPPPKLNGLKVNGDGTELRRCVPLAPVGPLQLLALPNSEADLRRQIAKANSHLDADGRTMAEPNDGHRASAEPNGSTDGPGSFLTRGSSLADDMPPLVNGVNGVDADPRDGCGADLVEGANGHVEPKPLKRQKSVRFSPKVESTTFKRSDPPSPNHTPVISARSTAAEPTANGEAVSALSSGGGNGLALEQLEDRATSSAEGTEPSRRLAVEMQNKEHLQLSPEEAFFLTFGLGALSVRGSDAETPYTTKELLSLFREHSFFPPRSTSLSPSDPFLVHYVVYHHFRSLGWVPRHGIKFGVDWLLYLRYVLSTTLPPQLNACCY